MKRAGRFSALGPLAVVLLIAGTAAAGELERVSPISDPEKLPAGKIGEPWVLGSQTSAVVYWHTENRARSCVEYGPTPDCPMKTPVSGVSPITGRPYWTQFHRITGLAPGRKYFYRPVCLATDGSTLRGEVSTFETKNRATAVRIPEDVSGPPYVLDKKNAFYVLTRDLAFPRGGLRITADGVTLDMDGHTLVYNEQPAAEPSEWSKRAYEGHDFGIKVTTRGRATLLNGVIRQGKGNGAGTPVGIGCNPVYCGNAAVEMAGVEVVWHGRDISGLFFHWGAGSHVHHCVMDDRGTEVTNRHQAISTIDGNAWGDYDHNLIKATRQQALMGGVNVAYNEIYINSRATNSFGIVPSSKAGKPVEVAHNRIIGIGEHPVGIAMFGVYEPGSTVHDNRVIVKCTSSGREYGYTGSACFRTTWGADNLDVYKNTFVAYAGAYEGKVAKARALWVGLPFFTPKGGQREIKDARGIFHDNRILALGPNGAMAGGICVVCQNQSPHLIFHNNTVTSTWGNVLLADSYGDADGYPKFVGNVFRRQGSASDYFTIRQEYRGRPATGLFLDNTYEDGAGPDRLKLQDQGRVVVGQSLDLATNDEKGRPLGGARVSITDASGATVFDDLTPNTATDAALVAGQGPVLAVEKSTDKKARAYVAPIVLHKGRLRAILTTQVITAEGKSAKGPFTVRVTKEGYEEASQAVTGGGTKAIRITLKAADR